jgi:hypothetical protein
VLIASARATAQLGLVWSPATGINFFVDCHRATIFLHDNQRVAMAHQCSMPNAADVRLPARFTSASLVSDGWFSYLLLLRCVPAGICTRIILGSTIARATKITVWPSDIVHSIGTLCICGTDGAGEDTCCEDEGFHFWLLGL